MILLRLFWRSIREPSYREDLRHRFGFVPSLASRPIWVHSVSAGETIAVVPLVLRLLDRGHPILVTTMTPTGRERVKALLGDRVSHCYAPYDLPGSVKRFLGRVKPLAYVVVDTELWPNTIHLNAKNNIPSILVNGRLSEKSARGYGRIHSLSRPMMAKLSWVCAQSEPQAVRFRELGANAERVQSTGSIKFDITLPEDIDQQKEKLERRFEGRQVFLAASTHEGEETIIINAYRELRKQQSQEILVIAPRHPHRADQVVRLCKAAELTLVRHSEDMPCDERTMVYLLDTMGELLNFYAVADITFVGGSLVDIGGHNPMEPASLGVPMLMGNYRRNIADIADFFIEAGAMEPVEDEEQLLAAWLDLSMSETKRSEMSTAARQVMADNKGTLERVEAIILGSIA